MGDCSVSIVLPLFSLLSFPVILFFYFCKVKRTLGQFTPAQWDKDEWHPLLGPWRFIQVLSLCVVFLTVELNTFFLKFCLWIPPRNPLIVYRLILWWLIAIPTIREYNSYLQDRSLCVCVCVSVSVSVCLYNLGFWYIWPISENWWKRLEHFVGFLLPSA